MVKRVGREELQHPSSFFGDLIERKSAEFNQKRKKVRTSLYASDVGNCARKIFYQFYPEVFPAEEIDGRTARIFANGEAVHERLQAYLADEPEIEFESELNVPRDELEVHGRCDGVAFHEGRMFVLEFKSINKASVEEAKHEHVSQLMWYLGMFEMRRNQLRAEFDVAPSDIVVEVDALVSNKTGRKGSDLAAVEKKLLRSSGPLTGEIHYEGKPDQRYYPFPVEYDEKKFQSVKLWFAEVKKAVESGIRPQVRHSPQYYPCSWRDSRCAYFNQCHGSEAVSDLHLTELGVKPKRVGDDAFKPVM